MYKSTVAQAAVTVFARITKTGHLSPVLFVGGGQFDYGTGTLRRIQ